MKTTLYDISDRYIGFMALVDSGEIDDAVAINDTLDSIEQEFNEKLDNIACLYKSLSGQADMIEAEAKKLMDRAKYKRNICDRLKSYMAHNMQVVGCDKFENGRTKVSFTKSKSLDIENEDELYESLESSGRLDLVRIVTERKFDKTAIKKEIVNGSDIKGATVRENRNIQIK